jgi:hypothetical protein
MAEKKEYRKYQIKHLVKAIVYEEIVAESFEKALEKASKTIEGNIFIDCLEVIDENSSYAGYDDITLWDEVQN